MKMYNQFEWDGVNKPEVYVDMVGQEIRVGDYIFYSVSYSSSAHIVLGRVLAFATENSQGEPYVTYNWRTKEQSPFFKLHVQPIMRHRGDLGSKHNKVYLSENATVVKADVSRASLPDEDDN